MFSWKRMLAELGWVMAMADPTCYSYYLASRIESTTRDGTHDVAPPRMVVDTPRYMNRARPTAYGTPARE